MSDDIAEKLSEKYNPQFGQIAVENGFATSGQIKKAVQEQTDDNLSHRPHRLLGRVLLDNGCMTAQQIEVVLNELFREHIEKNTSSRCLIADV